MRRMKQTRQCLRSTKSLPKTITGNVADESPSLNSQTSHDEESRTPSTKIPHGNVGDESPDDDAISIPKQKPGNLRTHDIFLKVIESKGILYNDETGRFPITSNLGNKYLVFFYIYDANAIKSAPIKNRSKE